VKPVFFATPDELADWLDRHHETEDELWVGMYKKASGKPSVTWPEVVEQVLRFGWIDGVRRGIDEESYANRITPRRVGSNWSAINVAKVEELKERGLMKPAGLRAYEARREDRTGVYSFERAEAARLPAEFEQRFRAESGAWSWWEGRPPGYRRTATHWVVSAKRPETRERRLLQLIECSNLQRKVPPLARGGE
jgi:uncharacterized protein YdeI (YjbR/CyaY-like superfamily)